MSEQILQAKLIRTVDPNNPTAQAVAVRDGVIVAIGDLAQAQAALPEAEVIDLGEHVLLPGFVEPHSHLVGSGIATMPPAVYVAPWLYRTWDEIAAKGRELAKSTPPGVAVIMFGIDNLLHERPMPTAAEMDAVFGDRPAGIMNLSGHGLSVTTATLAALGWVENPPADPEGGYFERNPDGSLTGVAVEVPAWAPLVGYLTQVGDSHPLYQAAEWYRYLAQHGITSTSDMMYTPDVKVALETLALVPGCPLRVTLYHSSTDPTCGEGFDSQVDKRMLDMRGVKIWADGTPWMGNIAISYQYLDTPTVRDAGIPLDPGIGAMNWSREQIDEFIDKNAPGGWQIACHANGDLAIDIVLDAFEAALKKYNLLGTDHGWRIEHLGGARQDQFQRIADLGVEASLGVFQMMLWGDLLDGQMFAPEIGSQWCRSGDAFAAGVEASFHNDGSVSRPWPLANIEGAVSRRSFTGKLHGPEQAITMDQAVRAVTINAARTIKRETEVGSLEVGKLADFVELSDDPYKVEGAIGLADKIKIEGTWVGGVKIDPDTYVATVGSVDPTMADQAGTNRKQCC